MKRHLLLVSASMIALSLSLPANADCVKVAYSRTTGEYGSGSEFGSCGSLSGRTALDKCYKSDCQIELVVQGQCGSIARKINNTQFIVSAKADNRNDAGNKAMAACGSDCKLVTTVCAD